MMNRLRHYSLVPLLLRFGLAVVFIFHGLGKVKQGGGTDWNNELHVVVQILVAWGELLGGAALLIGILTRTAAAGLALIMAGAIATVHGKNGFSLQSGENGGFEYNFVLIVMCIAVMLTGSGAFGFDHWFSFRKDQKK